MLWHVVIATILGASLTQYVITQDICTKFNIQGPCLLLQQPSIVAFRLFAVPPVGNPYCNLACSQDDSGLFSDICQCASEGAADDTAVPLTAATPEPPPPPSPPSPTATTVSLTAPRTATCYYSSQRPAQLTSLTSRRHSIKHVTAECNYPGVVGLFRENNGQLTFACMASLLEEDVLLINEKNCLTWVQKYPVYVMADSYKTSKATKAISLNPATLTKLDTNDPESSLYTVKLNSTLTLDNRCVQPVCVPNINIPASDIDLDDCRIVGYGDTTNTTLLTSSYLSEIKVRVDPLSITASNLTVTLADELTETSCLSGESAPLICSHKTTGEWVTVGVTVAVGSPCSEPLLNVKPVVISLLHEAQNKAYYDAMQKFKYADPNVFAADINSTVTP